MPETKKLQVFLCHASLDKPQVRELYKYLRRRGIAPWLDAENLLPGQDWQVEIPRALLASDAIIVCLSKNSVTKEGFVQKEIAFALDKVREKPEGAIFIIPAKLEECDVPARLSRYQWVDLHQPGGYQRLMRGLKHRAEQLQRAHVDEAQPVSSPAPDRSTAEMLKDDEAEKRAVEQAEAEKLTAQQAGQERLAREKAEAERIADEEAEKEHLAILKAENERIARLKAEQERMVRQKAEADRIAKQKAENESKAREKAAKEQCARLARAKTWARLKMPVLLLAALAVAGVLLWRLALDVAIPAISGPTSTPRALVNIALQEAPVTFTPVPSPTDIPLTLTPSLTPTPTAGDVIVSAIDGMKLHYVPAGEFIMGDTAEAARAECQKFRTDCRSDLFKDETPPHKVNLDAFWIDETEVTNQMYTLCVAAEACQPPSYKSSYYKDENYYGYTRYADYPVVYVSWYDAKTYCEWAGRKLPSEAQWEKAARGTDGRTYPWGNDAPNKKLLNYNSNVGNTTPVGWYPTGASPYGAYDMAGNVWEMVNDWYSDVYYASSPSSNPLGPDGWQYRVYRVLRGGSWGSLINGIRSADRSRNDHYYQGDFSVGFRCALSQ